MVVSYNTNTFRYYNLFNIRKIQNMYSPQNITILSEYYNNFKGIYQDTISNLSTFLMVNSLRNTCHH